MVYTSPDPFCDSAFNPFSRWQSVVKRTLDLVNELPSPLEDPSTLDFDLDFADGEEGPCLPGDSDAAVLRGASSDIACCSMAAASITLIVDMV